MSGRRFSPAGLAVEALLLAYPRSFRRAHARELRQFLALQRQEERYGGAAGAALYWWDVTGDAVRVGLRQRLAAVRALLGLSPAPNPAPRPLPPRPERKGDPVHDLIQDLRYALRTLVKNPLFTAVAILTLTLGIGANTAIFSVVDAVLLKPLNYPDADRLVRVFETRVDRGRLRNPVSGGNFAEWSAQTEIFEGIAAMVPATANLTGDGEPERINSVEATAAFFDVMGTPPLLGGTWRSAEATQAEGCQVVVSYRFWQRRFGGAPDVVEKVLQINSGPCEVLGVMPRDFAIPDRSTDGWILYRPDARDLADRKSHYLAVVARLRPGVTVRRAQSGMDALAARLSEAYPEWMTGYGVNVMALHEEMVGEVRPALVALFGAVAFVLLIACANVANLLLSRAAARGREVAIRAALGAGTLRLVRQTLMESVLLAVAGGAVGLVVAHWGVELILAASPASLPRLESVEVDVRILAFTLVLAAATSFVFGLAPAFQAARPDLRRGLRAGGDAAAVRDRGRLRGALVVAEVALAVVLMVGAGLMVRTLGEIGRVDPGFDSEGVLSARVILPSSDYPQIPEQTAFFEQVVERLGHLPGVSSAAATTALPLDWSAPTRSFFIEGRPLPEHGEKESFPYHAVTPGYFHTLHIALLSGNDFSAGDRADSPPVLILSRSLARRFWGDESPIGERIAFRQEGPWHTVIGVVDDVLQNGLDAAPEEAMFAPLAQKSWRWMRWMSLVIRTEINPRGLAGAIKEQVWSRDDQLPVSDLRTLDELVAGSTAERRFYMLLLGIFAGVALLLSACGIYGVMAYSVSRRTAEIGVRMALGATRGAVLRLVLRRGVGLTALGLVFGVGLSLVASRALSSLLFGVAPGDAATLAGVAALLAAVALAAVYVPARRAAALDPKDALRFE